MKVSSTIIKFRIDIDFPGCEVDMVLKEAMNAGVRTPVPSILCDSSEIKIDKSKLPKTPTENSVYFCLNWLMGFVDRNEMCITNSKWDTDYTEMVTKYTESGMAYSGGKTVKTELEEIGCEVENIYGLMQGTCHLICTCHINDFSQEIIKKAHKIVESVFKKYTQYYKNAS